VAYKSITRWPLNGLNFSAHFRNFFYYAGAADNKKDPEESGPLLLNKAFMIFII